ncbi:MAG: CCA tRNA nucleotidyltransferase [Candidatus Heimdallarchaeota archaeon]
MHLEDQYQQIQLKVLKKIRPTKSERELLQRKYEGILSRITSILVETNIEAKVELTGSFSRDTWISGSRDIDIFAILPYKSEFTPNDLLKVIKKGIDFQWIKKHAKHPYLFAISDDIKIEIVPCYEFKAGREIRSAVDRSPLHKQFISDNLPISAKDEVRLLKQFMRGVGTYGAEIKVHGFSGYLIELLIINYKGQFIEVLKNAQKLLNSVITFQKKLIVDENKFENEPLIVVDPTDKNRNVAAAVKEQTLANFIAAAKSYLKNPSEDYFFPKIITITKDRLQEIKNSVLHYSAIIHKEPDISDDILWGQIRKFEKSLLNYINNEGFEPINVDSMISKKEILTIVISQKGTTPDYRWKFGPPVNNNGQDEFLKKYKDNSRVVFGPAIIKNKWKILLKEKQQTIYEIVEKGISGKIISLPSHLQMDLSSIEILSKEKLITRIVDDKEKMTYLYRILTGKPNYLLK